MFAYAKNNQNNEHQPRDEYDCDTQVQQQTGINPDAPAPSGPSQADMQAGPTAGSRERSPTATARLDPHACRPDLWIPA